MADETLWIRDLGGNKALIPTTARDRWTVHGWSESLPPVDGEFVWMTHESDAVTNPALIPWGARAYWQGIGWSPSAPAEPVNPTRDPALSAATPGPAEPPDGTKDDVLAWVGDDRQRAEQALEAEHRRDKPRTTLVDALGRVGQPQHDSNAAMTAPSNEGGADRG